jgi:putative endopeptidase
MLGKAGYADPVASAQAVYDFEHKVAELEWARQALRNRDITYNKLSRAELEALAPGFPLDRLLARPVRWPGALPRHQLPPTAEEIAQLKLEPDSLPASAAG